MPKLGKKGRAYNPIFWASESTDKATILVNHFNLKEYCHAAHSQTQNKGFLSDENQHPILSEAQNGIQEKYTN